MLPIASILKAAAREHLTHDMGPLREPAARIIFAGGKRLTRSRSPGRRATGFALLMRLHSGALSKSVDRRIVDEIRRAADEEQHGHPTGLSVLFDRTIESGVRVFYARPNPNPERLIGTRLLVVKRAERHEPGVIVADYSYVFPALPGLFDLDAIAERYRIVLEPSWAGCCTPEILLYGLRRRSVFVETIEPRDRELIAGLPFNLQTVPIAANWWVDPRSAPPAAGDRDIDVIMVAAWSDIKRHWRVFKVLSRLRARGHRLKVALVGYRHDRTRADIEALASHFGIRDQVETFERISQDEVSALLMRSKLHVLWSRRECANRAIIEAMMADVPVIVREGLTFGYRYPYINEQTGRFVPEDGLADAILDMIANRARYSPREWVLQNMTCEKATAVLEEHLRREALAAGEPWTEGLAVKTSALDTQRYFNPSDADRFRDDYEFLNSTIRPVSRNGS